MKPLEIYTDGGCSGNPGPGGWAVVILDGDEESVLSGGEKLTTNNRMELTAVIEALQHIPSDRDAKVYTDSQYVKNGITGWIHTWRKNGWKTSAGKPVKNQDLWIRLRSLEEIRKVSWHWVKGHAGNRFNEEADALVQKEIKVFSR
ncbi:MAG: ribonuclease HI [Spirochaetales bacterium]|nr:ribonuclease HI [Spirochaetales bacterium]